MAQQVKDLVLSRLWLWLQLWHRFDPWHRTSACLRSSQKKKKKKKEKKKKLILNYIIFKKIFFPSFLPFSFFLCPHPQHMEVLRPGVVSKPQLQPTPQLQQCWIL